jgi:hypothetical protein
VNNNYDRLSPIGGPAFRQELQDKKGRSAKTPPLIFQEFDFCDRRIRPLPAAAATAAAVTATATAAAPRTLGLGTSFVHVQSTPAQLRAIQGGDSFLAVFGIRHFDKAKTTGTARVAVGHNRDAVYWSILLKHLAQFVFPRIKIQIPNEDILQAVASVR